MHSRKYIAHIVGIIAIFSSNPKKTHMTDVKRIFKFIKGTQDIGLWYKNDSDFTLKVKQMMIGMVMLMIKKAQVINLSF